MSRRHKTNGRPTVRCAIYTRKSTDEGLDQEFNSLDAQREAAEAYIKSQESEGWVCLPERYDDGGFTGGNMERPALKRLLADIELGRVDCIVTYKVDRLSRSLMDFARMMETFERHGISFVSVTQQFNTTHSMGRLTLNILLSFAQFEREIIAERTRDKIAAARRKGKWSGGAPILGYDVVDTKLVVNEIEGKRVRQIFELYLEQQALIPTARELNRRGWTTKCWTTKKGKTRGGAGFTKTNLYQLLTNVVYAGKVRYKDEVHEGEHDGIVPADVFDRVQQLLARNGRTGGREVRNRTGSLLRGLLFCRPCGCAMSHSYSQQGRKRYRYYVCTRAQKQGWSACPAPSVPAAEIERFVVDQIRVVGRDPALLAETSSEARAHAERAIRRLEDEQRALKRQLSRDNAELHRTASAPHSTDRLAELQDVVRVAERRLTEVREELAGLARELVDEREIETALSKFDPVWESLCPREQQRLVRLLVERVVYDGEHCDVSITFHPAGIKTLAEQVTEGAAE
jgi:site-specific DNA recombinase